MSQLPPLSLELRALFDAVCDETATEEQLRKLEVLLESDEQARRLYLEYCRLHVNLHFAVRQDRTQEKVRGLIGAQPRSALPGVLGEGFLGFFRQSWGFVSNHSVLSSVTALLVLCIAGIHVAVGLRSTATVARLVRLDNVQWQPGAAALTEWSPLAPGQALDLSAGRAELHFDSGAQLVLQGPARVTILDAAGLQVDYGGLGLRVGARPGTFRVVTPAGKVIDLGTEFALNVSDAGTMEVAVFDGSVDLECRGEGPRRLVAGQGLKVDAQGQTARIMSIVRGDFARVGQPPVSRRAGRVIDAVSDNVRSPEATYYYEIVPGGLDEDAPAYVDRKHEWNGVDGAGIPACLLGADYVRTFNDDRYLRDYEMEVRLARTADLYVFLDPRMQIPAWLSSQFVDTGLKIGIDEVQWQHPEDGRPVCTGAVLGAGPGQHIDRVCSVWTRRVAAGETVTLGDVVGQRKPVKDGNMYGVAAVAVAEKLD